jgi:hypothetical protein
MMTRVFRMGCAPAPPALKAPLYCKARAPARGRRQNGYRQHDAPLAIGAREDAARDYQIDRAARFSVRRRIAR